MSRVLARLLAKTAPGGNCCIVWTGCVLADGYGRIKVDGSARLVHRVIYEEMVGPIPAGLTIDHSCFNTRCVNPAHLSIATHRENILRGNNMAARYARRSICDEGHPFDQTHPDGWRICTTCRRANARRQYAARQVRSV